MKRPTRIQTHAPGRAGLMVFALLALGSPRGGAAPLSFAKDIQPILEQSCLPCHNATKSEGGLILESPKAMMEGGENGPSIKPNHALESLVYETAARKKKPFMPPEANKAKAPALSSNELETLRRWIDEGAQGEQRPKKPVHWQPMPARVNTLAAVAVSSNGRTAAAARGNMLAIYNLDLEMETCRFEAHPDVIGSLAFSPDGLLLASGSRGEIKIWRKVQAAAPDNSIPPAEGFGGVSTSPDGKYRAEITPNQPARLLETASNKEVAKLTADAATLDRIAVAELELAGAKFESEFLEKETSTTKERITKLKTDLEKIEKENAALQAKMGEMTKALAEAESKRDMQMSLRDAADESFSAATRETESAKQREMEALTQLNSAERAHQKATAEDKAAALKALEEPRQSSKAATEARVKAEASMKVTKDKLDAVVREFSEAVKASGSAAGAVSSARTIEINTKAMAASLKQSQEDLVLLETALKTAKESFAKAQQNAASPASAGALAQAEAVAFSGDGAVLYTRHADGSIRAWKGSSGAPLADPDTRAQWELVRKIGDASALESPLTNRVNALAFSPDGKLLASGSGEPSRSGELKLWDSSSGKLVRDVPKAHKDAVLALDFSRNGKLLASGSADRAVKVWDPAAGTLFRNLEAHSNHVLSVSFRNDSRRLASAGADNVVKTWDLEKSDVVTTFSNFTKEVNFLSYLSWGDELLAAGGSPALRILKDGGGEVRGQTEGLKAFITSAATTPDGRTQLIGEADGTLRRLSREGRLQAEWKP